MEIKIKRIHPNAKIPKYSKEGDAGMDVYATSKQEYSKFIEYGTGLVFEIPDGYVCLVFPRSSLSNKDLVLANHVGVLDSGYRGELVLRFRKIGEEVYDVGDRIGQIIILPYPYIEFEETKELSETQRGHGRFGSTGN